MNLTDQAMYFDDDRSHNFMMLNLSIRNSHPLTLPRVGSVVPYGIAVDSKFVYLSVQHPRYTVYTCIGTDLSTFARLKSGRLSDVYLSVAYIGPKSRTEMPRKTKIGTEVAHDARDSDTTFKVKRSKVKVTRPLWMAVLAGQHGHRQSVMITKRSQVQ